MSKDTYEMLKALFGSVVGSVTVIQILYSAVYEDPAYYAILLVVLPLAALMYIYLFLTIQKITKQKDV